jgi:hypothetical protein
VRAHKLAFQETSPFEIKALTAEYRRAALAGPIVRNNISQGLSASVCIIIRFFS